MLFFHEYGKEKFYTCGFFCRHIHTEKIPANLDHCYSNPSRSMLQYWLTLFCMVDNNLNYPLARYILCATLNLLSIIKITLIATWNLYFCSTYDLIQLSMREYHCSHTRGWRLQHVNGCLLIFFISRHVKKIAYSRAFCNYILLLIGSSVVSYGFIISSLF